MDVRVEKIQAETSTHRYKCDDSCHALYTSTHREPRERTGLFLLVCGNWVIQIQSFFAELVVFPRGFWSPSLEPQSTMEGA